jgi:glucan phosphoethanolaminetransferase (alkaline phosphatase superfamily)
VGAAWFLKESFWQIILVIIDGMAVNPLVFAGISLLFLILSVVVFKLTGVSRPIAQGALLAIIISIVAVAMLAQNYTQSLIPEANDGVSVSNFVAYLVIGEDGWSTAVFREAFEASLGVTILLILLYPENNQTCH